MRTKDLLPQDRAEYKIKGDGSDEESGWLDRTDHLKEHQKLTKDDKLANRATLCDRETLDKLPAAYSENSGNHTKLQQKSFANQNPNQPMDIQ